MKNSKNLKILGVVLALIFTFAFILQAFANSLPTVSTNTATSITTTSATLTGNITSTGGEANTDRGFDYGTDPNNLSNNINENGNFNFGFSYVSQFGSSGSGNGEFSYPQVITIDSSGNIYVADTLNNRIQKFNSSGVYQSKFGTQGSGNGQFNYPQGIIIDSSGNIYVADTNNHRIQKFNSSGVYQSKFGTQGSGNGQFNYPQGIIIDSSGNIYVADTNNHRIQKFNSSGVYQSKFGTQGSGNGQFNYPQGIIIDSSGNIYVADTNNHRIQKFNSSGVYVSQFGLFGYEDGEFSYPQGITIDSSVNIYVADTYNQRIQKFNSSGVYQSQFGLFGYDDGQFNYPQVITMDSSGNIYVADTNNHRIQKIFNSNVDSSFTANITGLTCNTTYYYRAYSTNTEGTGYGDVQTFTTSACPDGPIVNVPGYGYFIITTFLGSYYDNTVQFALPANGGVMPWWGSQSAAEAFANAVRNQLPPSSICEVCEPPTAGGPYFGYGTDEPSQPIQYSYFEYPTSDPELGGAVSAYQSGGFTSVWAKATPAPVSITTPTVSTNPATSIDTTSATLNADLINDGGEANTVRGFNIGTDNTYTMSDITESGSYNAETYSLNATGLTCNTTYYYRAYSTNTAGTGYGDDDTFTTSACPVGITTPTVSTNTATSITTTSATLTGNITSTGNEANTIRGFDIGTDNTYTMSDITESGSYSAGSYSLNATGLTCNTTYHYRAYSTNTEGTGYGDDDTFTTSACPVVSTGGSVPVFVIPQIINNLVNTPNTNTPTSESNLTFNKELKLGDNNNDVVELQNSLNNNDYPIVVPGISYIKNNQNTNTTIDPSNTEDNSSESVNEINQVSILDSSNEYSSGGSEANVFGSATSFGSVISSVFTGSVSETFVNITNAVDNTVESVSESIKIAKTATKEVIETKTGDAVVKTVTAVGIVTTTTTTAMTVIFADPISMGEIATIPMRFWSLFLGFLGIRRKNRPWGTVYDSVTKQPLDPAYVSLMDAQTGEEVVSMITDLDGRYGFIVKPGIYNLVASKTNYSFPSKNLSGKESDELYTELYFGTQITITEEGDVINKNIPLDPLNFDWNEFAKRDQNLNIYFKKKDLWLARISKILFPTGFVLSFIALIVAPQPYNYGIAGLYVLALISKKIIFRPKPKVKIKYLNGRPASFSIVRFMTEAGQEVAHKVADINGEVFCLITDGQYKMSVEIKNPDASYTKIIDSQDITVKGGYYSDDIYV